MHTQRAAIASRLSLDIYTDNKKKKEKKFGTLHEFACHPCAGAMLIFSVSFQF